MVVRFLITTLLFSWLWVGDTHAVSSVVPSATTNTNTNAGAHSSNVTNAVSPGNLATTKLEIDRIDIKGVTVFSSQDIENTLETSPGDQLEIPKVRRTEKNLQNLYNLHGYQEMSIQSKLVRKRNEYKEFENVLEFDIREGRPVRVGQIEFVSDRNQDLISQKEWAARVKRMSSLVGLLPGDILDQGKLGEGKRAIQELLASEEYIGGRITDVRAIPGSPPSMLTHEALEKLKGNTSQWVTLQVRVDVGDRVSFGYRGNKLFTRGHLDALVAEQKLIGISKDYVNVIRQRLIEEYHSAGYADVNIKGYSYNDLHDHSRKVTYVINEGPRVKIDSIDFDGNYIFSSFQLRQEFYAKAGVLIQHNYYSEKDVKKAAELLVEWLKEHGYLAAKLVTINTVFPEKPRTQQPRSSVRLLIYLYEGDQTNIRNITIAGVAEFNQKKIQDVLKAHEGAPLNLFALGDGIENLKKMYREEGYLDIKILNEGSDTLVQYSKENRLADISVQIEEGQKFRVSQIQIEGLGKTKEEIVRQEIQFKSGEVLRESQIVQTEKKLRRLGIFSGVTIRPMDDPEKSGYKIVRLSLVESDRGILTWGPGIRNDLGVRLFGQLAYTNLWGKDHTVAVSLAANRRFFNYHFAEAQAQFSYIWPWFAGVSDLTFRPLVTVGQTQYYNFAADNLTSSVTWDKPLLSHPNLMGYMTYSLERIIQFNAILAQDNQGLMIGTITPKLSLDLRDNSLSPTSGFYIVSWFDLANPAFGSQADPFPIGYYRVQLRSDYYIPLGHDIVGFFSFRTGYEQSTEHTVNPNDPNANPNQDAIPLIKQFALGGIGSVRGYQEQQINYQDYSIRGSLSYVNYRTQVDFPFTGALKFGVFVDAANLLVNNYSLGGLLYGTGFGFHYQTPVGPVSFDWGFKVNPAPGMDPSVLHFSVGVI